MAVATVDQAPKAGGPAWVRNYPPLAALAVALLLALAVLPSALNLPQTNPATTLEFAPVPPDDEKPPPNTSGNLSSLGLAGTSGLEEGGAPGGDDVGDLGPLPDPTDLTGGVGKTPLTKKCVGNPPRQTEDPLSPPCVGNFSGDNGGATYQGVTGEEIRILFYIQGFTRYTNSCSEPNQVTPDGKYFDLAQPPAENEHCVVRALRTWQTYFNDRYQTYNRFAHFFVFFSGNVTTAEGRRADAADNFAKVKPFAVISTANSFQEAYLESMAKRGVLNFGGEDPREEAFFRKFPGMIWSYPPSLEIQARQFSSYICTKVAPHPALRGQVRSGMPNAGKPRKYALWHSADPGKPALKKLSALVRSQVKACGVEFSAEATFPSAGFTQDNRYPPTYAQRAVADFQSKGITTVIWPGGLETNLSKSGNSIGFLPEVIARGDLQFETDFHGGAQDQNFWDGAVMVTNVVLSGPIQNEPCFVAYREADPQSDEVEIRSSGCPVYNDIRQLFIGIQVAGPRLTPSAVDKGFHAIPAVQSKNPKVPACFYEPGDYTCVKDAIAEIWDPSAPEDGTNGSNSGCYRVPERGLRFISGGWREGNVNAQAKPDDICNQYSGSFLINPNPPSPNNI